MSNKPHQYDHGGMAYGGRFHDARFMDMYCEELKRRVEIIAKKEGRK